LNQFDIPVGAVRQVQNGQTANEYTLATTVKDPNNMKYYYRTYGNQNISVIDFAAVDLQKKDTVLYTRLQVVKRSLVGSWICRTLSRADCNMGVASTHLYAHATRHP
jgi:penicillin V acylase-like amidase (Ntn superfamily)